MLVDVRSVFKEWKWDLVFGQSESLIQLLFPFLVLFFENLELKIIEIADDPPYLGSQICAIWFSRIFLNNLFDTQDLRLFRLGSFKLGTSSQFRIWFHWAIDVGAFVIYWRSNDFAKGFLSSETEAGLRSLHGLTSSLKYRLLVFSAVFVDGCHTRIRQIPVLLNLSIFLFLYLFIFFEGHVRKLKLVELVPCWHALTDFFVTILILDFLAIVITRNIRDDGPTELPFFKDFISFIF